MVNTTRDFGINMNKYIKKYAIDTGLCPPEALNDPEGYDGYEFYDKLTKFVDLTKKYYVEREIAKYIDDNK